MAELPCTGLTAVWCPNCGDCNCERTAGGDPCFDSPRCPLHSTDSHHADTVSLERCEQQITALAEDLGVELTKNDRSELSRFAQYLHEHSKRKDVPHA